MAAPLGAASLLPLLLASLLQVDSMQERMKAECYRDAGGTIYDYEAVSLDGKERVQLKQFAGKHVLIVNVATYCGLTAQYPEQCPQGLCSGGVSAGETSPSLPTELNALQEELKALSLVVLGFPCNQFGKQEPGENSEILPGLRYVRPGGGFVPNFQLFEKGDVNGEREQQVFTFLKKFLVGPDGVPALRWFHKAPMSMVRSDILEYLKQFKTT
ncbi:Epididymal secretory glutathione peroxidase [Tupaia chinensis]|uniref:Glutathione peroxidase 3 n=1 Tax=Tupaia chinensis TaxID=246437 RepID=L8YEW0_TUPCH|nr:Epididymal secretory glutathione peroxidase [Tupaia chinensis]